MAMDKTGYATKDLGELGQILIHALESRNMKLVDELRNTAMEIGHPYFLQLTTAAKHSLKNGYKLTPREVDKHGNNLTYDEKFRLLKGALNVHKVKEEVERDVIVGFNDKGPIVEKKKVLEEKLVGFRGRIGQKGFVNDIYRELFWDNKIDAPFLEILPEYSRQIREGNEQDICDSVSIDDAKNNIKRGYVNIFSNMANTNHKKLEALVKGTLKPEERTYIGNDFAYGVKVIKLSGVFGVEDKLKEDYGKIVEGIIDLYAKDGKFHHELVKLAEAVGKKDKVVQAYMPALKSLYDAKGKDSEKIETDRALADWMSECLGIGKMNCSKQGKYVFDPASGFQEVKKEEPKEEISDENLRELTSVVNSMYNMYMNGKTLQANKAAF